MWVTIPPPLALAHMGAVDPTSPFEGEVFPVADWPPGRPQREGSAAKDSPVTRGLPERFVDFVSGFLRIGEGIRI